MLTVLNLVLGGVIASSVIAAIYGGDAKPFDLGTVETIAAILVAPLTLALVGATVFLTKETRRLRVTSCTPHVVITLEPSKHFNFFELVIENVGGGAAFDVDAHFDPDIVNQGSERPVSLNGLSLLRVPVVKPNQRIASYVGRYGSLSPPHSEVRGTCRDAEGVIVPFSNAINIAAFEGMSRLGEDPLEVIARNLRDIAGTLNRRIQVDTFTQADRDAEQTRREEWYRQQSANNRPQT